MKCAIVSASEVMKQGHMSPHWFIEGLKGSQVAVQRKIVLQRKHLLEMAEKKLQELEALPDDSGAGVRPLSCDLRRDTKMYQPSISEPSPLPSPSESRHAAGVWP